MNFVYGSNTKSIVADGIAVTAILVIAYGLKSHYSTAGSEGLDWILRPTAWLVGTFDQSEFQHQQGAGYARADREFIIVPACAGINFMITAFCMIGMYGILYNTSTGLIAKLRYLFFCLFGAYLLTLCTNTLRILVSISLFSNHIQWGWFDPERVHRLVGIGIYLSSLLITYRFLKKWTGSIWDPFQICIMKKVWARKLTNTFFPYFWYIMMAVCVPLLNRGWQKGGWQFVEHCLSIGAVSLVVFMSCFLVKIVMCRRRS